MADEKVYYYMRLKEYFFDSDELIILESMDKGYIYSNILLKLYLKSLKRNGKLMLNDTIPYNIDILAKVTRHDTKTVEEALDIFKTLGLIEILDSGAIFITNIQNYIGKSSTEADRQREYQRSIQDEKEACKKSNMKPNMKSTPKKEIEKETNLELEKERKQLCVDSATAQPTTPKFSNDCFEMLCVETIIHSCLEQYPKSKVPCNYSEKEKWALEIDKLKRLDSRTEEEIRQALDFAIHNIFWKPNIRSTKKLREKFETLMIQSKVKNQSNNKNKKQTLDDFLNTGKGWLEEYD